MNLSRFVGIACVIVTLGCGYAEGKIDFIHHDIIDIVRIFNFSGVPLKPSKIVRKYRLMDRRCSDKYRRMLNYEYCN